MILPEYRETIFKASPPEGGWPEYFHIITAYNPGKIISDEENAIADEELRRDLAEIRGSEVSSEGFQGAISSAE